MQEIHSIENGRNFFCGVNRSMNPHHLNTQTALNCPRCNSLNTKFCYYNNYNLSQPRHFCKNCRRYWTKGGVLRNVPVGGGSRKSKRSTKPNNKKSTPSTTSEIAPVTTEQPPQPLPEHSSNSHSSSESSTLTAAAATEAISAPASNAASNLFSVIPEQVGGDHCGILTSLTSTSFGYRNNKVLDASSFCFGKTHQQLHGYNQVRVAHDSGSLDAHYNREGYPTTSFPDQTMPTLYGGFGSLDWHTGMGQNLFDLPNTVDQSYWTNLHLPGHYNSTLFQLP